MSADIQTHTSTPVGYYWKPLTFFKELSVFPCSSQRVSAEIWLFAQHKTYSNKQITHSEAYMLIHYNQQTQNNFNLSFVRRLNTTAKVFKLSTILCSISFFFLSFFLSLVMEMHQWANVKLSEHKAHFICASLCWHIGVWLRNRVR